MAGFKVKAVFDYSSPHEDDLNFSVGQIITVTEEEGDDWYVGEYTDETGTLKDGLFPRNFVEKYEPEPPPRPNRTSRYKPLEQPQAAPAPPTPEIAQQEAAPAQEREPEPPKPQPAPIEIPAAAKSQLSPTSPISAASAKSPEISQELPPASKPPASKKPPPPVAVKSNAFRDRIAAFNQPAAAPVAPFKPGGGPPTTFIKKPFVAPPPSRNAYVPPPREAPQVKTYRRDEDPEIAERQIQDQENAGRAGLSGTADGPSNEDEEEQPKPTSLKERIALLQKQQAEQAQRAAAAQHKEKPKKPPMKKTPSHDSRTQEGESPALERVTSNESRERGSMDHSRPPRSAGGVRSPDVQTQHREFLSDANDADQSGADNTEDAEGSSTSVEEEDDLAKHQPSKATAAPSKQPDVGDEDGAADQEEEDEEEEDEMDAETRRKLELRERMAKMSGGMGMAGMFGPPGGLPMGGLPPKKKKPAEKKSTGDSEEYAAQPQRIPMFPGMPPVRSPDSEDTQLAVGKDDEEDPAAPSVTHGRAPEEVPDLEELTPQPTIQRTLTGEKRPIPPPTPTADRPAPPPVPSASRPAAPLVPVRSPSPGSESGDELTDSQTLNVALPRTPSASQQTKRTSYLGSEELSLTSPDKRAPPPIPFASPPMSPTVARPPPPPPPTAAPSTRQPTTEDIARRPSRIDRLEGESEYEGDYDTDIAPGATHKEALKSHVRDTSLDDSTNADETPVHSPVVPSGVPPLPPIAPRAVPPPPPQQPPSRASVDAPRAVPPRPPVPPPTHNTNEDDDEYDPYNYSSMHQPAPPAPRAAPPPPQSQPPPPQNRPPPPAAPPLPPAIPQTSQYNAASSDEDDLYSSPPPRKSHDRPPPPPPQAPPQPLPHRPPPPPQERAVPPPPPQERVAPLPPPETSQPRAPAGRKSLDVNRVVQQGRVSMDQQRPSVSLDFMASEIDLGASSHWWTQSNMPPPSLNGRKDVLIEMDETRSGNSVEKVVVVLYMDYSQTIITAEFEANNVSNVKLEQRQDPPPARLRQDQLEAAHEQFGARIAKDVEGKQNTIVGDGTPHGLIHELLKPYPNALRPVSTRSFGALVYANLANASTQQYDEIRPGDVITFRNAKFQGKHGAMHAKYSVDVGKPDHVGVVVEWDGSKKKIRAWEQGRESKKVKPESFRMGDLRSGEVRVWRVMARSWVGWN